MRRIILLFLSVFLLTCTSNKSESSSEIILESDIKISLEYLASDELGGRRTGSEGIEKAATYVETIFKNNDIKPYFENYRDSFSVKGIHGYNIVGYLEGNDNLLKNEFILVGAHYDHLGKSYEIDGDDIANGANDNASGIVSVLELAKYFSKSKSNKRSILFSLFAGEEMGLLGSTNLSNRLKQNDTNLYTMLNFEMVGVPRDSWKTFAYITGYNYSNIADKLNAYSGDNKTIGFLKKSKELQLFKRSDNYPFYIEFNIPAHTISTFDFTNYEYYDHIDDEVSQIDFEHLTTFISNMIPIIESVANSASRDIKLYDNKDN